MDTDACKYCQKVDNIHYLIYCNETYMFWNSFSYWWNALTKNWNYPRFMLDAFDREELIIFGYYGKDKGSNVLNYCILYAKNYIHVNKQMNKNINFYEFLPKLKLWLKLDKVMWNNNEHLSGLKLLYVIL